MVINTLHPNSYILNLMHYLHSHLPLSHDTKKHFFLVSALDITRFIHSFLLLYLGPWRPHKLRLFSPSLTPLFREHSQRVFGILLYAISESCDTKFAGQVVYKPWGLSVSSKALMPITAILIPAADCVLLLHQLVIGLVTVHLM